MKKWVVISSACKFCFVFYWNKIAVNSCSTVCGCCWVSIPLPRDSLTVGCVMKKKVHNFINNASIWMRCSCTIPKSGKKLHSARTLTVPVCEMLSHFLLFKDAFGYSQTCSDHAATTKGDWLWKGRSHCMAPRRRFQAEKWPGDLGSST